MYDSVNVSVCVRVRSNELVPSENCQEPTTDPEVDSFGNKKLQLLITRSATRMQDVGNRGFLASISTSLLLNISI